MRKVIVWSVIVGSLMTGCSSSAPECSDSDARALVLDISMKALRDKLVGIYMFDYSSLRANFSYNQLVEIIEQGAGDDKSGYGEDTINELRSVKARVDKRFEEEVSLGNIRTDSKDEDLKKSVCSAVLMFGAKEIPIRYKLEITSEDELYATVYGL